MKRITLLLCAAFLFTTACSKFDEYGESKTDGGKVNGYNVNLSSLEISDGIMTPVFDQTVTGYSVEVENEVETITVTPEAVDAKAAVTVNGVNAASGSDSTAIPLAAGTVTTITIIVTAPDETTKKTYTISAARLGDVPIISNNCLLSNMTLSHGTISDIFTPTSERIRAEVASSATSVKVTPTASNETASIKVNGTAVASGDESQAITLAIGKNWINIDVTASDGVSAKRYIIECVKLPDLSTNGFLSNIYLSTGSLSPLFNRTTYSYTSEVASTVSSITMTPVAAGANETIKVNGIAVTSGSASGSIALSTGANTITVPTTSEDTKTELIYTVVITRLATASTNAILRDCVHRAESLNQPLIRR